MRLAIGLTIFAVLTTQPAFAERPDNHAAPKQAAVHAPTKIMPLCEVWASTEAPNVDALVEHEEAHCWGWEHPKHAAPKPGDSAYRAAPIPAKYRALGHYPKDRLIIHWETEKDTYAVCDSWGCQFGGVR